MTHLEKLDFIRTKCNLANPALLELGFGCEIEVDGWECIVLARIASGVFFVRKNKGVVSQGLRYPAEFNKRAKILGRLPSLADILLAIEKKDVLSIENAKMDARNLFINCEGQATTDTGMHLFKYNLLLPFDQQDEPCIDFLFELLK